MSDDRRNQEGRSGRGSSNPLYTVVDMLAAAWGTAVGIGRAVLGVKRSEPGKEARSAAGAPPMQAEPSPGAGTQGARGAQPQQRSGSEAKPEPSAKLAPSRKEKGRRATTVAEKPRQGARQAAPAKQGAAAKAPGGPDKAAPRPKASQKHPAPPRPGAAVRAEAPAVTPSAPPAAAPAQRPPALDVPRGGKADDLKQIAGIGPKLEEKLNGLGIYHYDQIAGWGDSAIAWIDAELQAKGRVERDNWVGQAAALRSGVKPEQ